MAKTWVLDSETKGTGANMVPLEKVEKRPRATPPRRRRRTASEQRPPGAAPKGRGKAKPASATSSTPLPPGHVRKKATGEIGRIQSADVKAGTARVHWLKRGATSTVPLSAITRR